MQRSIVGWEQDEQGDWVALLACEHRQHVRHRPPFFERPWVEDPAGRAARVGAPLDCPLCDAGAPDDDGGDPACYAHLVCPECGAVLDGPGRHRPSCPAAGT